MTEEKPSATMLDILTRTAARAMEEAALFQTEPEAKQAVAKTADKILYQDPAGVSKRVWSVVLMGLSVVLMDPGIQQALVALLPAFVPVQYLPAAGVLLAAVLTTTSKMLDPRLPRTAARSTVPVRAEQPR